MAAKVPTVSEVNAAKGDDLRKMFKIVFDEETTSKDSQALKAKIIAKLKADAKAPAPAATDASRAEANALYLSTEKAAFEAEKKGEWLQAALAWESVAKMLSNGKGRDLAMERAAKARVNAKAPAPKAAKGSSIDSEEVKAAKAKAAEEKAAAKAAAEAAEKAQKEAAKAAKEAERAAKKAAEEAEAAATKAQREADALAKREAKEAEAAAAAKAKEEAAAAAAKAKEEKAAAVQAEKDKAKADREAERAAKKAAKEEASVKAFEHDPRVAHLVGQKIIHETKHGVRYEIDVVEDGFIYKGKHYPTLSAVGKYVNGGKSTNGFVFFGLSSAPRPELKDVDGIIGGYLVARQGLGDLPKDLEKLLDGTTVEAHAAHAAISAAMEGFETRAKALRLALRLIEAKKGKPQPA